MKINHSEYTISELLQMFERKELVINKTYQRGGGVWPSSAKSYFIDTILEGFPFPKIYIYQSFDKNKKKPLKEIVDGQQRLTTIKEFVHGNLRLSSVSENFSGHYFNNLDDEKQEEFFMYSVPADVILAAERPELLEMFRRINSYTAPLNPAEKRHANFNGEFKWFINDLSDKYSPILQKFGVLTEKQIIRMGDAELLAELVQALDEGIINKSAPAIQKIYTRYDEAFPQKNYYSEIIRDFFDRLIMELESLRNSFLMKPYAFYSLFCAFVHLKYGIPQDEKSRLENETVGQRFQISESAVEKLHAIAEAHETQDIDGHYSDYVKACSSSTTKVSQRKTRTIVLETALLSD